jgi:hypothetical protein
MTWPYHPGPSPDNMAISRSRAACAAVRPRYMRETPPAGAASRVASPAGRRKAPHFRACCSAVRGAFARNAITKRATTDEKIATLQILLVRESDAPVAWGLTGAWLEHVPAKWTPVCRKEHAPDNNFQGMSRFPRNGMCSSAAECRANPSGSGYRPRGPGRAGCPVESGC